MPTIDQVEIPSLLIVETSAPSAPGAGDQVLYIDPADHVLKRKDSGGSVHSIENAGSLTHAYLGYNTIGGSNETITARRVYAKSVTPGTDGLIASIGARLSQSSDNVFDMAVAVFSDNGGVIGNLLAVTTPQSTSLVLEDSATPTYAAAWIHVPVGLWVVAGTYWIAVMLNSANGGGTFLLAYDGSGSDRYYTSGGAWFAHGGRYSQTDSTQKYSIRASFLS